METKPSLSSLERQEELRRFVEQQQRATVAQIAEEFSVSLATVRRDLDALAERGEIQRFHGGALAARKAPPELPVLQRESEQAGEKQRIGRAVAELIEDGETVFISSGTTALEAARNLRSRRQLTVITNSLPVINVLTGATGVEVIGLGGMLRHSEMSMIGHITEQALAEVHAHKIIMGIRALDLEYGLTNDYLPETVTDRAILGMGGEVIVVADHTKCGSVSTACLAPVTAMDKLVTDSKTSPEFVEALQARGIEVIVT
ncbi:MAG: DeoR/GlpR transcriptional regulator [Anaerolineae bacterium]|nr:DeoR/GlpR transcriptional regulator [Anaerolineae bacterium]